MQVENCKKILKDLEKEVLTLTSVIFSLFNSNGKCLVTKIISIMIELFHGIVELLISFQMNQDVLDEKNEIYLKPMGLIWAARDKLQQVPKTNKGIILENFKEAITLIEDAILEVEEMLSSNHVHFIYLFFTFTFFSFLLFSFSFFVFFKKKVYALDEIKLFISLLILGRRLG